MPKISQQNEIPQWESIARNKRKSRDAKIPREWQLKPGQVPDDQLNVINVPSECGILTAREQKITQSNANILVENILSREYSSYEVCH